VIAPPPNIAPVAQRKDAKKSLKGVIVMKKSKATQSKTLVTGAKRKQSDGHGEQVSDKRQKVDS
jgi:hypothetical protein